MNTEKTRIQRLRIWLHAAVGVKQDQFDTDTERLLRSPPATDGIRNKQLRISRWYDRRWAFETLGLTTGGATILACLFTGTPNETL